MNDDDVLNHLYYVKHNYDGVAELYKKARVMHPKITKPFVAEWLKKQQTVQMTTEKVGKKEYLPIFSDKPYAFQIDLTFFPRYKKQNNDYYVLYTAININTRFVYAYYCKNKDSTTILDLLKKQESKTVINSLTMDEGTEFKNKYFQDYCNKNEIEMYFIKNDSHKLGIINRFHRTLKDKLTKYFSAKDTVRWVDVIDDIVYNYNHSVNRGIGMEPYKVNSFIENELVQEKKEITKKIE
jgi:IS30 family transposase